MKGEGLKLGGVFAVDPKGDVKWEHREASWGDTTVVGTRMEELKAAVSSFGAAADN